MAEQFLTLMADLDDDSQAIMSAWYNKLNHAGFSGTQTPDLPYHISMASFPLEQEQEVIELAQKVAGKKHRIGFTSQCMRSKSRSATPMDTPCHAFD